MKAVTIGIGFKCTDGSVLCADNQITWPANHKYYESKIYRHGMGHMCVVAFTFAGNPNLVKMFFGKFQAAADIVQPPHTASQIQDLVETVLSLLDLVDTDPDGLHLLCGVTIAGAEVSLLKTERKVVSEVRNFDYVGVGDSSLLSYLSPLLVQGRLPKTIQAGYLGRYLVQQAKRYIEGCGGEMHFIILPQEGRAIVCHTALELSWSMFSATTRSLSLTAGIPKRNLASGFNPNR